MLAIKDLACGYHREGSEPLTIVAGINRSVLPGQRIGILGANGQGKSTVVKTLAHMNKPISGEITEGTGLSLGHLC
ncbi:ATP-binding cassette domain-containing protein, partial [Acinetobacter baumannii]|uniref:ATP-binding cassette domain-containing protein n=1 Tax=Acinetobacter baumannii TaxID=470 RepID=UPI001BB466BA